jgi:hypothetical protein
MISTDEFKAIDELDLDPIKVKLMHRESGEGWTLEYANQMEVEYRRFLYLTKAYPGESIAPLFDVDTFWHYHILDTMKYAEDCDSVFGYFLHHYPYLGLGREEDDGQHQRVGDRMKELYQQTFGESCVRAIPGRATMQAGTPLAAGSAAGCFTPVQNGAGRQILLAAGQTAWCFITPPDTTVNAVARNARQAAGKTAWCFTPEGKHAAAASKTAWCFTDGRKSARIDHSHTEQRALVT